ncbi:hypothetical protein KP509_26G065900 [Ceratopteris richardii]|uniref:dual-specificity kinase n=4 Tax=Ceratopteris richardii TaxID=49495 RepID=A0A8T2RP29_CERRI|nr:hypothetical protein KP509_26G065900 [Ceratopteris richardii]
MATDLVSASHSAASGAARKRRRFGWDDPSPAFYTEDAGLRFQPSSHLMMIPQHKSIVDAPQYSSCSQKLLAHQLAAPRKKSPPWQEDDKDGHFNFKLGDDLTSRYKILQKMGEGTFGRVLECWDRDSREIVAIKVIRSAEKYREAAMIEVDILRILSKHDRDGSRGCVQIRRWFDYRNHICIVFEKLGPSLFDFLKANDYRPFSVDLVREFGRQLLESVAYMHSLSLIHTDLKPENILLVSTEYTKVVDRKNTTKHSLYMKRVPKSSRVKLIDFGSTTYDKECSFSIVSTRHYRAPEVILGCGWSYPCDIWSVGCILVELCSGEVLFQTHENLEHLAMMERVLGLIPPHVIRRSTEKARDYFRHGKRLNWPDRSTSGESIRAVHRLPRLRDLIVEHADKCANLLVDILERMLKYDPYDRPTAREALNHPFFQDI